MSDWSGAHRIIKADSATSEQPSTGLNDLHHGRTHRVCSHRKHSKGTVYSIKLQAMANSSTSIGTWIWLLGLFTFSAIFGVEPSFRHFYRFLPPFIHLLTRLVRDLRLKDHSMLSVDAFQLFELFPHIYSKTSGNGSSEGSSLPHHGSIDWNIDDICLSLTELNISQRRRPSVRSHCTYLHAEIGVTHTTVHC